MEKVFNLYEIGGCVRDRFLGLKSKDIDYSFEFKPEFVKENESLSALGFYNKMNETLVSQGFTIHLEVPEAFTTRAKFPEGHIHSKLDADFVLCRKETYPNPHTRMPVAEIGTLMDDLTRRDFTMNAIAIDELGNVIDPFNGRQDIKDKLIRCPVTAAQSFNDDPLRMVRALRFSITKDFSFDGDIQNVILSDEKMWNKFATVVSTERIRMELLKMFKHNTVETMRLLVDLGTLSRINIMNLLLRGELWFEPTTKKIKKQ